MTTQPSANNAQERPSGAPVPAAPSPAGADPSGPAKAPLPNERDEAGDTTGGIQSERVQQGHEDVKRGLRDTSRGEASDDAYQKQK